MSDDAPQGYRHDDDAVDDILDDLVKEEPSEGMPQGDTSDKDQGDKLIAGKYRTMADVERAVKEATQRMHAATMEAAQLKRQLEELQQWRNNMAQLFAGRQQVSEEEYRRMLHEALEKDPVGYIDARLQAMLSAKEQERLAYEAAKDAWHTWVAQNPEYNDPDMQISLNRAIEVLNSNRDTAMLPPYEKLEQAKKMVEDYIARIMEKRTAKQTAEMKKAAGMNLGVGASSSSVPEEREESVSDYIRRRREFNEKFKRRF